MKPTPPMPQFGRRTVLRSMLGLGAVAGGLHLSGCSGADAGRSANRVRVGCFQGDEVPKKAFQAMVDGYSGEAEPKINFVDHETFKNGVNNYLQGNPDDIFTWFSGYRARFFEENGLVADLSDLWEELDGFPESIKNAASTTDGRQIMVPLTYYPWGVFYRPSVWQERGYSEPATKDEWLALCEQMKADGLIPLAFAAKDGWEPMGTFDMLNLRVNGYDYHISLMAGEEAWDGEQVKNVFKTWNEFTEFQQSDSLGRTWQDAAQALMNEKAGMMTMGMFIGQQFEATGMVEDLDFFIFPEFDSAIGADVVEAPVDTMMMRAKPKNESGSRELLKYLGTPDAVNRSLAVDGSQVGAHSGVDQSQYSKLQKKAVEVVNGAANLSQFLDRDTRPDFASTAVGPALQSYVRNPGDLDSILKNVEAQKKSIFGK